ncbi:N-acetylmuramic acid 6-phosphate etherase [Treponema phagedenis F0421]|uniref:N-acetylmuramic acid 6-phosphate etherase n=1 Tax=Treponema phagedenis TaxID=162 RepID=UPI0001F63DA4|nr:N-acetylmuramic acid 6-phosphate etherase [Treponema phagedenis]EFW38426.1 N-acetylmuramic acid 6-phosphate etherase [Treponema phagedenis F0421]
MIDLSLLATEKRNPRSMHLDKMSPLEIAALMNAEDARIIEAVKSQLPQIAEAIALATEALKKNARIIYIGAGTSGRLGMLDAAECPPTFGVPDTVVIGLIAGGERAFIKAVEGAEDSHTLCEQDLRAKNISPNDIVICLAASGRTPYVVHGLRFAKEFGCKTVAVSCTQNAEISAEALVAIELLVGPEVLTGSTRLKAGTAQKMVLNMISTGSMIGIGKVYQNMMVDLMQTNEKLHVRAENNVMNVAGCTREAARKTLDEAGGSVKLAATALLLNVSVEEARQKLAEAEGHIYKLL